MNAWLNGNYVYIIAVIAGIAIRWAAMRFMAEATRSSRHTGGPAQSTAGGPPAVGQFNRSGGGRGGSGSKWNKGRVIKILTLLFVVVAGLLLSYGLYSAASRVIGWGKGFSGIVGIVFGVATLAAGWHSLYGLIALVHDLSDGTPDKEAFSAGFWVPTTVPLGWAALAALFGHPHRSGAGVAAVAVSAVTIICAHRILKRTHSAEGHYRAWMWLATIISAFVGIVHITALAYLNQLAGQYLPEWLAWILRAVVVISAVVFLIIGLADVLRDFIPERWSQWAAMYTIPAFTVLAVSVATLQANASHQLTVIFGAFR